MPETNKYDYADALHKSLLFYHAQRSGQIDEHRLAWRTHSCLDCKGDFGEDLSGGWFEAANTMKWTQPKAFTVTQLAFSVYMYGDAMKQINEKDETLKVIRWGSEYFINGHPRPNVLVGVLGLSEINGTDIDFGYFGPPEEYEKWAAAPRQAFYVDESNPSTEMAGQVSAALAATSVVWREKDPAFADECLRHAKELHNFADKFRGTYKADQIGFANTQKWYPSSGFLDELASANIWLYIATNEKTYLQNAQSLTNASSPTEYSWDDVDAANVALLYKLTGETIYADKMSTFFKAYLPGGTVKQTPKGLSFHIFWGSLRYAANHAFLALVHADNLEEKNAASAATFGTSLRTFATQQINYMLGDAGRSWVVGFGENSPKSPYHKSSYNSFIDYPMRGQDQGTIGSDFLSSPTPNRFILYGALVGGPRNDDSYLDDRTNYEFTEVTQDYNAGFIGSLGGLVAHYGKKGATFKPSSDCNLDLGWDHPNAKKELRPSWPTGDCYHTCEPCSLDNLRESGNMSDKAEVSAAGPQLDIRSVLPAITATALTLAVSMLARP